MMISVWQCEAQGGVNYYFENPAIEVFAELAQEHEIAQDLHLYAQLPVNKSLIHKIYRLALHLECPPSAICDQ